MLRGMKPIKYAAWIIALALLAGCATTFRPWKLSEVEEGMNRAEVVYILGEPDFSEMKDGAEFLHYSYQEDYNPPLVDDSIYGRNIDRRFQELQLKQSLKEYRYAVKLIDGKVQAYKELTD